MSGPPPGLGLDGLEQAKMPTSKANTGSFKRNIASARRFLETLKDSCSSNPTTVSFFMALITSWKARRLSTEDLMNRLLLTLTTPTLQEAFNAWLPRGFHFEPARPGRKVLINVVEATARDAVWAQAVGGVFVAACRELVDEGRAAEAEASPVTGDAGATADKDLDLDPDPSGLYFFWYADIHLDIWRWAPAAGQFLGRVLQGYRGGYDRQVASEKGMPCACPVAAALLGEKSSDINDIVEMVKRRLTVFDEEDGDEEDGDIGGNETDGTVREVQEETLEAGCGEDTDTPDLRNDSDDETVLPDSSPEPESPELEEDAELAQEMAILEQAELDTRALLCGLHFVHRVFELSSISDTTDIVEDNEPPKSKKGNKKRKRGRRHKKKRTTEEKHAAQKHEHCVHEHDPYLRFLDLVLMHAYELERSDEQEDMEMWRNLLFWRFEQMFKDKPEFVDAFKKFWEAPEDTLNAGKNLDEDSFSYLLGV